MLVLGAHQGDHIVGRCGRDGGVAACRPTTGGASVGELVFDGLKVIDCASFIAGPAAATVMSDFGAEVIKIEPPGMGDPYRRRATPHTGPGLATNPGFVLDGRNKKSLALDLRAPSGQLVLRRLVADADVFITNYPPPVRRRLGITYDDLAPLNEVLREKKEKPVE